MKRFALLIVAVAVCATSSLDAQVIGTYRPSLVTYYPSATSVTPIAYRRPIPTAGQYGGIQLASHQSATYQNNAYPIQTIGATAPQYNTPQYNTRQYNTPVVNASYGASSPYIANSPVIGGNCGCAPVQTISAGYPAANCAPTFQQPIAQVAYQQPQVVPYQNVGGGGRIDDKYYVGQGLLGRPKVYADGQPVRNALRSILP